MQNQDTILNHLLYNYFMKKKISVLFLKAQAPLS